MATFKSIPTGDLTKFYNNDSDATELLLAWKGSPYISEKNLDYFQTYSDLLKKYRGKPCTLIEIGVKDGGSLHMWQKWLGKETTIVGIDLNHETKKLEADGFKIFVGDQGDPDFLNDTFKKINGFDILIDDGSHTLLQQINTITVALKNLRKKANIIVEDTQVSFMKKFQKNQEKSFLDFAKDVSDLLTARHINCLKDDDDLRREFPSVLNVNALKTFGAVQSVQFFPGIVHFQCNPHNKIYGHAVVNKAEDSKVEDFRGKGINCSTVDWPYAFTVEKIKLNNSDMPLYYPDEKV